MKRLLLSIVSALLFTSGFAQNITFTYNSPQTYTIGKAVTPLPYMRMGDGIFPATLYAQVNTIAGSGTAGLLDASGTNSKFNAPAGICTDGTDVYVADAGNNVIRKISGGQSQTFGSGIAGYANGSGAGVKFSNPDGVCASGGVVYVADYNNNVIRQIAANGTVTTFAGSGAQGAQNGTGTAASFYHPASIVKDPLGNLFVADEGNNIIRKITPQGVVTTYAGNATAGYSNSEAALVSFNTPKGLALDGSGNLFLADYGNNVIRKITPLGLVTTYAGNGKTGSPINGQATEIAFTHPTSVTLDTQGNLYVSGDDNVIRKVTAYGVVTTVAGNSSFVSKDGVGSSAGFNYPNGIATDQNGNLYVTDKLANTIRKVNLFGWYVSPNLPAGLSIDATGTISGTPTSVSNATDYTVYATTQRDGSGSANLNITVAADNTVNNAPVLQQGQWTWASGSSTPLATGNSGTKGVAAASNVPTARQNAARWTDNQGNYGCLAAVLIMVTPMIFGNIIQLPAFGHG